MNIIDRTAHAPESYRRGMRDHEDVQAAIAHQMGCGSTWALDAEVWDRVRAHFVVRQDGSILMLHHPLVRMNVGSGVCNAKGVTIEMAGSYASDRGKWYKPEKFGRDVLGPVQVEAGRDLMRWLCAEYPIRLVIAHRHIEGARRGNCPGPAIWGALGQWSIDTLGLTEPAPLPGGLAIPDSWRRPHGS